MSMKPFNAASLHKVCTQTLLRRKPEPDGYYARGEVSGKEYAISTYFDCYSTKEKELSRAKILQRGESIIDIYCDNHDAVVAHPRNLRDTGNFAERGFLDALVKLHGKQPDKDTPVVFTTDGPRFVTPKSDPWLQAIFEDLLKSSV
jgi:hypothetical protein